nr:3-oxoacyl-ACP synthase [Pseudomonas sp.]
MTGSVIAGTGSFLPPRVVSNDMLAAELAERGVETSNQWIVERTGIRQRHLAARDVTTSMLATEAARAAIQDAGVQAEDVDLIIVATSTPDFVFPSTACLVQANLGAPGGAAFDVQAVCSGFVYALTVADSMIRAGRAKCAIVIGAEVFSRILDWSDRGTCV